MLSDEVKDALTGQTAECLEFIKHFLFDTLTYEKNDKFIDSRCNAIKGISQAINNLD